MARAARPRSLRAQGHALAVTLALTLSLALGLAALACPALASGRAPLGVLGRWTLRAEQSELDQALLGPAPEREVIEVTRDDGDHIAFRVELTSSDQTEVETGDVPLDGGRGFGHAAGVTFEGRVLSLGPERAVIRFSLSNGARNEVTITHAAPDTLVLEEELTTAYGDHTAQRLVFARQTAGMEAPR